MGKPCISSWFIANVPVSIRAAFFGTWTIVISLSGVNADANLVGLGQNSGFPSAPGNFNIIFMLIFCYSVLAKQFSSLSSSSLLFSLSLSIFFPWNTNYAGSYYWCHFKQEQTCQFCTVVTPIIHNKERLKSTGKKIAHAYNNRVTPSFRAGMLIVKVHTQWLLANMSTAIRAAFFGTFTIAIPRAGLNTGANLTGSGLGTQTRFCLCCNIINSPFPHFHNALCLAPKILHKNCFHFLLGRL